MSIESVMPSSHLILCRPPLLLPPIPPSIRVYSNESTLRMRWPKYWNFSFSIIPSKEIPGLISFRMDKVGKTTRTFRYDLNQIPYDYTVEVRNRFKGLDLIDRVPDEIWNEVHDFVQGTGIKTIPMEKKCKKAKWLSGEALQIAVKRREVKSKGEKERYKHLNAEFQRIARREKTAFFSDQCKEIEENNRMGKTRDLFKKIRDTKGTFHAKMGSIKDTNGMDLRKAEDIKKRWQEYTEELYKKDLHDPDNHYGVIIDLEPDILECEVKWALESITTNKASGGDRIPVELFQILKDDAVKVLHSI
ncbi:uncharacterized protein [Bos taurus]|uniref:uncharacterized protein n=1 Tax=Bos taurus TaxID=9913 RepID=UPI0028CBBB6B|nr:uncharacterized protein LOC101909003 [Bos taurus]